MNFLESHDAMEAKIIFLNPTNIVDEYDNSLENSQVSVML